MAADNEISGQWKAATEDRQYLRERVDHIAETLARNTVILENNTESLKEHMRRTEILEIQMDEALLPIRYVKVSAYILTILGTIAAIFAALK